VWLDACHSIEFTFSQNFSVYRLDDHKIPDQEEFRSGTVRFDSQLGNYHIERESSSAEAKSIVSLEAMRIRTDEFVEVVLEGRYEDGKKVWDTDYSIVSFLDPTNATYSIEGALGGYIGTPMMAFGIYPMGKGYILHRINDSFAKMSLSFDQQEWQGKQVYRLIGMDGMDKYEVWLDPVRGFMPVRITYQCDDGIDRNLPEYFTFDFQVKSSVVCNNIHVPDSYVLFVETVHLWNDKGVRNSIPSKETTQGEISNILVGKSYADSEFRIKSKIPDYTEVFVQDAIQIQHVWLDGKVVPLTDELALARARGHGFMPGMREPRFWLMALGIIMMLIGSGMWIYKNFIKKDKDS
jgi:hypothetical protein